MKQGLQATYGNLLEVFVRAGLADCAEMVCEVLRKKCEHSTSVLCALF